MVTEDQSITSLANAIALALGDGWTGSAYSERTFCLKRLDGLGLFVRLDRSRLVIGGDWGELYDFLPYLDYDEQQRWCKITVSASRSPQAIAKQIHRRLLPVIIPAWETATQKYQQHTQRICTQQALTQKLAHILGESRLNPDGDGFTHSGSDRLWVKCYCQYHNDAVNLEVRGVTPQQAEAILLLLTN